MITWDQIYNLLGIKEFIYFISSPVIQQTLFPVKIVFIFFTLFFLVAVIYFYYTSSYLHYQFLQDAKEVFSREASGLRKMSKSWKKIKQKIDSGREADFKLAVVEADDFLYEALQDMDYKGDTFEELINDASKKAVRNLPEILEAHSIRNAIVYEPDYKLDAPKVKRLLDTYEEAIKSVSSN